MKKLTTNTLLLILAVLSAPSTVTQAAPSPKPLICPVTHLPISSPAVAVGKSQYHGKTYYFCTANCKALFDKNPAKYVGHH